MKISDLEIANHEAIKQAEVFMDSVSQTQLGVIDEYFHQHKNRFPFFGFVSVSVGGAEFTMFSGNDDLVAMTYFWYGADSYEPMSMNLWQERASTAKVVLDVGAFSGIYSLVAATTNTDCSVYSVEAARRTYGRLLLNTQINQLTERVQVRNVAVSNGPGIETFQRFRGENILGIGDGFMPKKMPPVATEERVATIGLDEFCQQEEIEPDLIKIDVEGAEVLALEGMSGILSARKATFLIEVTPQTAPEVVQKFISHGFNVFRVDEPSRNLISIEDGEVTGVVNLFVEAASSM